LIAMPTPVTSSKGQHTRAVILDAALSLATQVGLEGLSIGALAESTGMSKSGVFAHFGSREELQISVIREYHHRFEQEVFYPSLQRPRGLPRLRSLFELWVKRIAQELDAGCLFIGGAAELDDRPGPVRDALAASVSLWLASLHRAVVQAQAEGHLPGDWDARQVTFELHGLVLALHHEARFLRTASALEHARRGFDRVLGQRA
jgi:AcrR family transcriptional regulator